MELPPPTSALDLSFDATALASDRCVFEEKAHPRPLIVVQKPPRARDRSPSPDRRRERRKTITITPARRMHERVLQRCFGEPGGMRDVVKMNSILSMTDNYRLSIAKEWQRNLALERDFKPLVGDAKRARPVIFEEMFPAEAATVAPVELFISCGVAPDLLQVAANPSPVSHCVSFFRVRCWMK